MPPILRHVVKHLEALPHARQTPNIVSTLLNCACVGGASIEVVGSVEAEVIALGVAGEELTEELAVAGGHIVAVTGGGWGGDGGGQRCGGGAEDGGDRREGCGEGAGEGRGRVGGDGGGGGHGSAEDQLVGALWGLDVIVWDSRGGCSGHAEG
jgi:hypothetical protein